MFLVDELYNRPILGLALLNLLAYEKKYCELVLIFDVESSSAFSRSCLCDS